MRDKIRGIQGSLIDNAETHTQNLESDQGIDDQLQVQMALEQQFQQQIPRSDFNSSNGEDTETEQLEHLQNHELIRKIEEIKEQIKRKQ